MDKSAIKWIAAIVMFGAVCLIGNTLRNRYDSVAVLTQQGFEPADITPSDIYEETAKAEAAREEVVFKININTAGVEQLCELAGIGEKTAQSIIKFREDYGGFKTTEEIKLVEGIGDKTYFNISKYLTVE